MKRIIKSLLCICMLIGLAACNDNMSNPIEEQKTLEDINNATGGNLVKPDFMEVTNESYNLIDGDYPLAEYNFESNGCKYCFRFSKAPLSIDISGIYFRDEPLYNEENCSLVFSSPSEGTMVSRWPGSDGQYVLICEGDFEQSDFMNNVYEFTYLTGVDEIPCETPEPTSDYTVTIEEDGDNIIYTNAPKEGSIDTTIHKNIFYCEGEKIVKVVSESIYESSDAAKKDYDFYISTYPSMTMELNDNVLTIVTSENGDEYEGFTRSQMLKSLQDSADYENNN